MEFSETIELLVALMKTGLPGVVIILLFVWQSILVPIKRKSQSVADGFERFLAVEKRRVKAEKKLIAELRMLTDTYQLIVKRFPLSSGDIVTVKRGSGESAPKSPSDS